MQVVKKITPKRYKADAPKSVCRLSAKAHAVRRRILREWVLTDATLVLLDRCLSYSDQADNYQAILDKEGLTIENVTTGAARPHPALSALKLARSNYLTAWRMLDLRDEGQKAKPGRPVPTYPEGA